MTQVNSKPALAEVLVRQVLGDTETLELICAQRGVSLVEAVTQALRGWMGDAQPHVPVAQGAPPLTLLLPDPSECPQGQEREWLGVCDHDLSVLRAEQRRCFHVKDATGLSRVNQSIERYIQAVAELKERVA